MRRNNDNKSLQAEYSLQEAYKEYREIRRNVAVKRLNRLEAAGETSGVYRQYQWILSQPAGKIAPTDIRKALEDIRHFVNDPMSTIRGIKIARDTAATTLQEHGYDVEAKDVDRFRDFMKSVTVKRGAKIESASAADMFVELKNAGGMKSKRARDEVARHFNWYKQNLTQVVSELSKRKGHAVDMGELRKRITKD